MDHERRLCQVLPRLRERRPRQGARLKIFEFRKWRKADFRTHVIRRATRASRRSSWTETRRASVWASRRLAYSSSFSFFFPSFASGIDRMLVENGLFTAVIFELDLRMKDVLSGQARHPRLLDVPRPLRQRPRAQERHPRRVRQGYGSSAIQMVIAN